jgi:hypothetical protein
VGKIQESDVRFGQRIAKQLFSFCCAFSFDPRMRGLFALIGFSLTRIL